VDKTYGEGETAVNALKDVSFSVNKGEFLLVVGSSGSGKSTRVSTIHETIYDGQYVFSRNSLVVGSTVLIASIG